MLYYHAERITAELKAYLEETLRCACLSIFRRNAGSGYTNISIMGFYVTLAGGQLLDAGYDGQRAFSSCAIRSGIWCSRRPI